jgi:hypothetical protein
MYEQCLYCCYIFHSHSRVCMNSVCISVLYFTVTVGYAWTYCDYEMYNGNTNTVHTYPTVTVKCITPIQTLFMHTLLWLWNIKRKYKHCSYIPYCDCEIYNSNTNIVHTYPTVTMKCITAIQTLFIHTLLWLWNV